MVSTDTAEDIIKTLVKAKKNLRLYPDNNPVYVTIVDDLYARMTATLEHEAAIAFRINQYDIMSNGEVVYENSNRSESLALFFFKDGIREISFSAGMKREELQGFLKIISMDFDRDMPDDDIVTLLWEQDFHRIKYIVDDTHLMEDGDYETDAVAQVKGAAGSGPQILQAYSDAFHSRDVSKVDIHPLTDDDIKIVLREITDNELDKTHALARMIFEMHFMQLGAEEYNLLTECLKKVLAYAVSRSNMEVVMYVMRIAGRAEKHRELDEKVKSSLAEVNAYINSAAFIELFRSALEGGAEYPPQQVREFSLLLDTDAIPHLMNALADMESISTRRMLINILTEVGRKDLSLLAEGLNDDRWFLVRNMIYVFRQIGDADSVSYLSRVTEHKDKRVRKEVVYALGEMGSDDNLQLLKCFLSDTDKSVRVAAIIAAGRIGSPQARDVIMQHISSRGFRERDMNEKKDIMQVFARWNDDSARDFLIALIRKRKLFGRKKHNEMRASALFCLGLMGNDRALPLLEKVKKTGNKLLSTYASEAVRTIGNGTVR